MSTGPRHFAKNYVASSAIAVIFFLLPGAASLLSAQNKPANPNPKIDANQLVQQVVQNELQINDPSLWRLRDFKSYNGRKELRDVIQLKNGEIDRLLAINLEPLTPEQKKGEDARIQDLVAHPAQIRVGEEKQAKDTKKEYEFLRLWPSAFQYTYAGMEGNLVKLSFVPDPRFHPPNREAEVFHHMAGTMLVDPQQKRLAALEGRITSRVNFGGGLLGHLDPGGMFSMRKQDLGSGHWEMTSLNVQMKGKALIFHTINMQQTEERTDYQPVPDGITLQAAAKLLENEPVKSTQSYAETQGNSVH